MAELGRTAAEAHISPAVAGYIVSVAEATRSDERCELGVSTRGALALARCAKVFAMTQARAFVTPDDVKALAHSVLAHRLIIAPEAGLDGVKAGRVISDVLASVPVPVAGGAEMAGALA
ncbi:MAG: MoxR family ATPase [Bifidobacteriaceae bacterium]|nr:MoxR family ATPase [Bifidobacteriaceae bacterium]